MSLPDPVAVTSGSDQVIQLLNTAQLASSADSAKLDNLRKVQEIIVNREPDLLDNFLDEVLAFQTDRSQDVRKFVVGFIEDACKKDTELLPKVIANLQLMLGDSCRVEAGDPGNDPPVQSHLEVPC